MLTLTMLLATVLLLCFIMTFSLAQERTVIIERIGECENTKNEETYPFQILKLLVHRQAKHNIVVNGSIIVHEVITGNLSNFLLMTKCALKESPDTCEVYTELITDDICRSIHEKEQAWYTFMDALHITQCPIQKGTYVMNEAAIDMSLFTSLPASLGYWKLHGELRNETHVLCCVQASFIITPKLPSKKYL